MRKIPSLLLALGSTVLPAAAETPAPPSDARARELIDQLGMEYLEHESGYLSKIGRSELEVTMGGETLRAQSQVYYLLTRELPINFLHWLAIDDTHILIEGGPVDYYLFHPDGRLEKITLGRDVEAGERPVVPVPGNCRKALVLHPDAGYALIANVLSPEWTPDEVKVGAGSAFIERYAGKAGWAAKAFLRELIGPNWLE